MASLPHQCWTFSFYSNLFTFCLRSAKKASRKYESQPIPAWWLWLAGVYLKRLKLTWRALLDFVYLPKHTAIILQVSPTHMYVYRDACVCISFRDGFLFDAYTAYYKFKRYVCKRSYESMWISLDLPARASSHLAKKLHIYIKMLAKTIINWKVLFLLKNILKSYLAYTRVLYMFL